MKGGAFQRMRGSKKEGAKKRGLNGAERAERDWEGLRELRGRKGMKKLRGLEFRD